MNTNQWEDRIISYLEGDLDDKARLEIEAAASGNAEINDLWNSYKSMYEGMDAMITDELCLEGKMEFDKFLNEAITQDEKSKNDNVPKVVRMSPWKTLMAVAAVTVGILFVWNNNQQDQEIKNTLASVNTQLEEMMNSSSSTDKIKAIRVSHDIDANNADLKTKQLLVNLLKNDPSSNVRLAAVEALEKFTDDEQIRTALIKGLSEEEDGFVKVALIKALGQQFNNNIANTFEEIANDKSNEKFIRDEVEKELFKHNRIKS